MEDQYHRTFEGAKALAPTLRDLLAVVFRHRRLAVSSFLAVLLGTILSLWILPKQYEGEMKILVSRERTDPVISSEANPFPQLSTNVTEEELNSEVEILKSRDLLGKVVVACGLQESGATSLWASSLSSVVEAHDENSADDPGESIPKAVRTLGKRLRVEPVKRTNVIAVTYKSTDPQQAARVLTTLANFYLEKHVTVHRPPGAFDFFKQEAEQHRNDLASAEERLAGFGRNKGVVAAQLEKELTVHKLTDFQSTLQETQAAIAEAKQRIRALEKQAESIPRRLTTEIRKSDNGILLERLHTTLLDLELKRTELLAKFDPSYRPVQEVEAKIAQARAAIATAENHPLREEITDEDKTYEWVDGELAKARTELAALEARAAATARIVRAYRENASQLDGEQMLQQDLLREAKVAEDNYLLYLRKREESRIADALDQKRIVNVAIAEAATVPALPSNPAWLPTLLLGILLGTLVGLGAAFVADYLDPTIRTPDELEQVLNVPVLSAMPKTSG
jgi:uncharacterized protein involved in exopolysaccharide biosynthesis